jgi:Flp pilus assembly protein TadD
MVKIKKLKNSHSRLKKKKNPPARHGASSQHSMLQQAIFHHQAGHLQQAEAIYRQILLTEPNHPHALHNLGILAHQTGNNEIAAELIGKAVGCLPDFAEAHYNLGVALYDQGRLDEALASFRQAISLNPQYAEAHCNLGNILMSQGRLDEASASYRQALTLQPNYVDAHYNLGTILMTRGNLAEAAASFRQALALQPDFAEAHCNLGITLKESGNIADAVASLHNALLLKPDYARAYSGLALIKRFSEADDIIRTMEDLYTKENMPDTDRVDLGFALGKAYEDLKNYDRSFGYIHAANRLKRQSYEYSIQNEVDYLEKIKATFSADFFHAHHNTGRQGNAPIFIVGMPRSGTTLIEQILASHPLVFGAGELEVLRNLVNNTCLEKSAKQFPECMPALDKDDFEKMGSDYIQQIRAYSADSVHITDKMPYNFLRVGIIKVILPHAKVVHCSRNPMDTCYSIFKKDFRGTARLCFRYD